MQEAQKSSIFTNLYFIWKASRPQKQLPLVVVMINGALVRGTPISISNLILCGIFIFVVAMFGGQLNNITDREVDKDKKPYLYAWLVRDPKLLNIVFLFELAVIFLIFLYFSLYVSLALGFSLFMLAVANPIYSYNFLTPKHTTEYRLKIYWWGHALTMFAMYFSILSTGYLCSSGMGEPIVWEWLMLFSGLTLMYYSVFLSESAGDAEEERKYHYKSFAAMLGYKKTTYIAIMIWLVSIMVIAFAITQLPADRRLIITIAYFPAMLIYGACCLLSIPVTQGKGVSDKLDRLVDITFWVARLFVTFVLLASRIY